MHNNRIIISGASGRLAKLLVERIKSAEYILLGRDIDKLNQIYSACQNAKCYTYEDFINSNSCGKNFDMFIHCAFERSENTKKLCDSLNLTVNLLNALNKLNINNIINISSMSVYSSKEPNINNELENPAPSNFYGLAKYSSELLIQNICAKQKVVNIRLSALAGSVYDKHILSKFVKFAIENKKIEIIGGSQNFCFMDYRDAIDALEIIINSNFEQSNTIYNIGNNLEINIVDMAEAVINEIKSTLEIDAELILTSNDKFYFDYKLNADKFMKDFNWYPKYSLSNTISEIIESYRC